MNIKDISHKIISGGKQTIDYSNELHSELSKLNDYDFSQVVIDIEHESGLTLVWDCLYDTYEVY